MRVFVKIDRAARLEFENLHRVPNLPFEDQQLLRALYLQEIKWELGRNGGRWPNDELVPGYDTPVYSAEVLPTIRMIWSVEFA